MKPLFVTLILAGGSLLAANLVAAENAAAPKPAETRASAKELFGTLPDRMPGSERDSRELVELGRKLYFETRLSVNQKQSCNTCHAVDKFRAGVDGEPTSPGAFGKRGARNSPTVLNAGLHFSQFWDGRAATLEDQAKGPILNPVEMAMPDEKVVLQRIKADKEYPALFNKAFPMAGEKVTYDNLAKAIAAFERTLLTHDRMDDFLKGDDRALTAEEIKGLNLFAEVACTTCHNGPLLGANTYQKVGLINPYDNETDVGRFEVTKDESDKFKFKVPSLRNIALTGAYFHDGATVGLEDAVTKISWMQLGRKLESAEAKSLVAFLSALSDKERAAKLGKVAKTL